MPINFTDKLEQTNRQQNVSTGAFFHLMSAMDVDFTVEKIIQPLEDTAIISANGVKYVVLEPFGALSPSGANDGDIVIYLDGMWQVYTDVSNPETAYPIIFDKRTQKFYQRTNNEWIPIINSKSSLDGGTF